MKTAFSYLFLFFVACNLFAQNFDKTNMDALFDLIEKNERGMGTVALFENGKEIYSRTYGFADLEKKTRANAETKYRIGSITKTFTATVILKLVEEKKLSLTDKLAKFYPKVKNADKITIEDLLRHRSGIYNFTNSPDYLTWNTKPLTKTALLAMVNNLKSDFEPNTKTEYSNSNYVLLTWIAEDAGKKPLEKLLEDYVFKPSNLKNTRFGGKIRPEANEAKSYQKNGKDWVLEDETDMSIPLGAGAITSTPADINLFLSNLLGEKLISKESLEKMKTIKEGMGMGLIQVPFYEKTGFGHTGGIDGFQSQSFFFPDQKLAISIFSNGVSYSLNDISIGILSNYFGKNFEMPVFTETIVLKPEELEKYVGVYGNPKFPLKITIDKDGNTLTGQATGQSSFPLECIGQDKFKFDAAKIEVQFISAENKMIFKQMGRETHFVRE